MALGERERERWRQGEREREERERERGRERERERESRVIFVWSLRKYLSSWFPIGELINTLFLGKDRYTPSILCFQ